MIFNLAAVVECRVITVAKQRQVDIENVQENARRVKNDYAINDIAYVEMTGIYHTLGYSKNGPYRITQVLKNGTV